MMLKFKSWTKKSREDNRGLMTYYQSTINSRKEKKIIQEGDCVCYDPEVISECDLESDSIRKW